MTDDWTDIFDVGDCWTWTRAKVDGYGQVRDPDAGRVQVHRALWEILVGLVPEGLELDHLCRNRACANPDHLEPVTRSENVRRGRAGRRRFCLRGHDTHQVGRYKTSNCVACERERSAQREWVT